VIATPDDVLAYWFAPGPERPTRWFRGDAATDADCRQRFASTLDAATRGELAAIADAFEHAAPVVRRLRELLVADPRAMTLERAAAALGHSTRSLQRHLAEEHSSFRDELAHARIHAAKQRLVETDDKIEVIARELGFRSVPAFTTMFGRAIGEAPQAYRQRHRP